MRRSPLFIAAVLAASSASVGQPGPTIATHSVPLTISIFSVDGVGDDLDGSGRSDGDFYAGASIAGGPLDAGDSFSRHVDDQEHPRPVPAWTITRTFVVPDDTLPAATVTLEIWDHDNCDDPFCDDTGVFESNDDRLDIKSGSGEAVALTVNLNTGRWTGDANWPANCVTGDGGEAVKICFDISIDSGNGDADGDGLLDGWERNGFNADGDSTIDVDLPSFGATVNHIDAFLELDWSAGQAPNRDDIQAMVDAFADAPFTNLDGTQGIRLHVDTGSLVDPIAREGQAPNTCNDGIDNAGDGQIDAADTDCDNVAGGASGEYLETSVEDPGPTTCGNGLDDDGDGQIDVNDIDCLVGDNLGGGNQLPGHLNNCGLDAAFYNAKSANFSANRAFIFRYAISTQSDQDTDGPAGPDTGCGSGGQGEIGGNDFIDYNHDGGTVMHELGHNLNLRHGGNEDNNCKPNYVSSMDYDEQFGISRVNGGVIIDYSPPRINLNGSTRGVAPLPQLVENALDETVVLDATDNANVIVFKDNPGNRRTGPLTGGIDWNGDSADPPFETTVPPTNINTAAPAPPAMNRRPGACASNTSTTDTINGFHDWNRVSVPFRQFGDSADSAIRAEDEDVPTIADRDIMIAQMNTTDVSVSIADSPDPVGAGERLTLTLTATNHGPNPAHSVEVRTTLPAGVTFVDTSVPCIRAASLVTCNLGSLADDESQSFTIRVDIPADFLYPGGQQTITTSATVDNLYGPDPTAGNDSDSESTLVITKADVRINAVTPTSPLEVLIGEPAQATIAIQVENLGPSSPVDTVLTGAAGASSGSTVAPTATSAEQTALSIGTPHTVSQTFTLTCATPGFKTVSFNYAIALKDANGVDPDTSNNTKAASFQVDCVVPIAINVRPGGFPNSINLRTDATLAALTTTAGEYGLPLDFDATTIDGASAVWGVRTIVFNTATVSGAKEMHGTGHIERSFELDERTRDADLDMVFHFKPDESGLTANSNEACLKVSFLSSDGNTYRALGCDSVVIRGR
ncbi:MAG: NEW3 domain-containing protein [Candidatus Limnocylindria bacterium]